MAIQLSGRLPALQTGPGKLSFLRWGQHSPRGSLSPLLGTATRSLPPCSPGKPDVPRGQSGPAPQVGDVRNRTSSHPHPAEISGRRRRSASSAAYAKHEFAEARKTDSIFWMTNFIDRLASGLQRGPLRLLIIGDMMQEKTELWSSLQSHILNNPKEQISFITPA